jgi:hypothetical protein
MPVPSRRSFVHCEDGEFRVKLKCELWQQHLDCACQIADAEELPSINAATLENVVSIYVHQARRSYVDSAA